MTLKVRLTEHVRHDVVEPACDENPDREPDRKDLHGSNRQQQSSKQMERAYLRNSISCTNPLPNSNTDEPITSYPTKEYLMPLGGDSFVTGSNVSASGQFKSPE